MGHQSYMIPYDTEEQLQAILDTIKKHNIDPFSNEFVRYSSTSEFEQLVSGEDLTHVATAIMKKPYKTIRNGPTLSNVVMCGHGGGRGSTFHFFDWELRRRLNNPAIMAYGYEGSMSKRIADAYEVPQEQVGGGDCVITAEAYDVRPALFTTREVSYAGFKRTADQPYLPPTYTTKTVGYVVGETRFDDLAAAEARSVEKKRELAENQEKEKARIAANMEKYKGLRAAGKDYYYIVTSIEGGHAHHHESEWLTKEMAAKRAESHDVQVFVGKLLTNKSVKTTTEIDEAVASGEHIEVHYI